MVCTTANIAVAIGAVLFAARGCLAAGCNDGVLFVPHTNPHFHVPSLQSFLEIMLQTVETERLLESVDSAVNPTFNSNGGIKSNQNDWDCVQTTNAGLFYWPDGDVNTEDPFYYNHDRAAMLAHAAGGVNGCGSQHLVIHPDFRIVTWTTKSLFEVPEYVREGIRLWTKAVPSTTDVVVVLPREQDAAVVLAIAATFDKYGPRKITVLPVGFARAKLTGQTATNANSFQWRDRVYQLLEAACMYSLITGNQYTPSNAAADAASFGVAQSDLTNLLSAAHAAVQEAKPYNDGLGAAQWAVDAGVVQKKADLVSKGKTSWFVDVKHHTVRFETWGTSTESGLKDGYNQVAGFAGMGSHHLGNTGKSSTIPAPVWRGTVANPTDVMLKRSMAFSPGPDDYFPTEAELPLYKTWMKFDYQYDKPVGSRDKGIYNAQCMDAYYFGSTWSALTKVLPMVEDGQKGNIFPMRWFIAEERISSPTTVVMRDSQHLHSAYLQGVASGMLTLVTGGRSFVGDEPARPAAGATPSTAWQQWHARSTGYALAWRLATLRESPPWLEIKPTSKPSSREESLRMLVQQTPPNNNPVDRVTVRFLENHPPTADVVVTIGAAVASQSTAIRVVPSSFTVTSENYNDPVVVTIISTGEAETNTDISVVFTMASDDPAVDGVSDSWVWAAGPKGVGSEPTGPTTTSLTTTTPRPDGVVATDCGAAHVDCTNGATPPGVSGRYLRIDRPGTENINLAEVQAFDHAGSLVVATGAALNQEWAPQYTATKCTDGDLSSATSMCHSKGSDPWLRVDFGATVQIAKIVVTNRADFQNRIAGATVAVTSDPDGADTVWSATFDGVADVYEFSTTDAETEESVGSCVSGDHCECFAGFECSEDNGGKNFGSTTQECAAGDICIAAPTTCEWEARRGRRKFTLIVEPTC